MCHEILNANPYAFLDDAPLEERRARAVALRRIDPDLARGVGALDQSAIDEVRRQAWPDVRDADELHDLLLSLGILPMELPKEWEPWAGELVQDGRAVRASWTGPHLAPRTSHSDLFEAFVATERVPRVRGALPDVHIDPDFVSPLLTHEGLDQPDSAESIRAIVNGWVQILGPTTAPELARRLALEASQVGFALTALECDGIVLRGRFTPGAPEEPIEWCERRLLSRIHRLTMGRLRREIEAVPVADFMRFLLRWQHVQEGTHFHGREGIAQVIGQLQGVELPARAWERDILPARIGLYNPDNLEALCLSGEVAWGRFRLLRETAECDIEDGERNGGTRAVLKRRRAPTRSAPLALALRADLPWLLEPGPAELASIRELSPVARRVAAHLERRGASFVADIARAIGCLAPQVEEALWELVSRGLVTGDGIAGLRLLLKPQEDRRLPHRRQRSSRRGLLRERLIPVGRWSLLRESEGAHAPKEKIVEAFAWQLLRRYGVVMREVLSRENLAPAWRELLAVYRRLEAQGEIRGGRFVAGLVGEQFALPQAVEALRAVRRKPDEGETTIVSAADPLNLVGVLLPGPRLSPFSEKVIAYRAGLPIAIDALGAVLSRIRSTSAAT
jgi:ATP-dependent Lhr-like helicase